MKQTVEVGEARRFLFLLASARRDGNTEALARGAAARLQGGVEQEWLRLIDLPLDEFFDIRHVVETGGAYPDPSGHARRLLDATLAATDLVFVVPLYWYSLPACAKRYLDHWSGWMRVAGVDFKARMGGKTVWAISTISDEDRSTADPLLGTLKLTASYMGMRWGGSLLGFGNRPGDVMKDKIACSAADLLFEGGASDRES
jgi:NAD(P)H-dependent FMN reductase